MAALVHPGMRLSGAGACDDLDVPPTGSHGCRLLRVEPVFLLEGSFCPFLDELDLQVLIIALGKQCRVGIGTPGEFGTQEVVFERSAKSFDKLLLPGFALRLAPGQFC